jgi:hypothetical protein
MSEQHNRDVGKIVATDEFRDWYRSLNVGDGRAVARLVEQLEIMGVSLPFAQSGGRPLRVFYIFDRRRDAVLLIGGDKTGDDRFYERMIPTAERIWEPYCREQGFEP